MASEPARAFTQRRHVLFTMLTTLGYRYPPGREPPVIAGIRQGDDRTVDEEPRHGVAYFGTAVWTGTPDSSRTFWPARTRSPPSTTTRSPGFSPSETIQSAPT